MKSACLAALALALAIPAGAQTVVVTAGRLLDARKGSYVENAAIWIEGERIKEAGLVRRCRRMPPGTPE